MAYNYIFQLSSIGFYSVIRKYIYYPRVTLICFLCCLILIIFPKLDRIIRAILLGTASGILSYLSMVYLCQISKELIHHEMAWGLLLIYIYGIPGSIILGVITILINLNSDEAEEE